MDPVKEGPRRVVVRAATLIEQGKWSATKYTALDCCNNLAQRGGPQTCRESILDDRTGTAHAHVIQSRPAGKESGKNQTDKRQPSVCTLPSHVNAVYVTVDKHTSGNKHKLHRIKVFSARITYRWFPPVTPVSSTIKIEHILISLIIASSEGGFRSRDERKRAEKI
jgi:hypothetical protein